MALKNYVRPCLELVIYDRQDVVTVSTEYGFSWSQAGWGGSSGGGSTLVE